MAVVKIAHHPELTSDSALDIFRRHFAGRYEVRRTRFPLGIDFVVKRNGWIAQGVRLQQRSNGTSFVLKEVPPNLMGAFGQSLVVVFTGMVAYWVVLRPMFKAVERDLRAFIESAKEFQ